MDIPESRHAGTVVPLRRTGTAETAPTAETYAALQTAFDHLNRHLFGGDLPNALVTLTRRGRSPGYFRARPFERADGAVADEIAVNPARFRDRPPAKPLAQLAHDMVHLWQRAFGTPGRGGYHNREWAAKMVSIGLQPTATGAPSGKTMGERMGQMVIPNGPFASAVAALEDSGFAIPWSVRDNAPPDAGGPDGSSPPRSGRWFKYVCPTCGAIARARHGASLICGDDYTVMEMDR